MNPWYYQNQIVDSIDPKYVAFVYIITNLISGKQYIGLKTTRSIRYKALNNKRKKVYVESDWKSYWSSSDALKTDVEVLGQDNFKREIIHFCEKKAHANYLEAKEQYSRLVLEHPEKYYNQIINVRVNRSHLKTLIEMEQC